MKAREFPAVTVPLFDHSQIQTVLEINNEIIAILKESQNNAWNEDEQRIYAKRLWSNLTFLGTLADSLQQSTFSSSTPSQMIKTKEPPSTRSELLSKLIPPTMIYVPDPNSEESSYYQVPPFAGNNPQKELGFYKVVDRETSTKLVIERNLEPK